MQTIFHPYIQSNRIQPYWCWTTTWPNNVQLLGWIFKSKKLRIVRKCSIPWNKLSCQEFIKIWLKYYLNGLTHFLSKRSTSLYQSVIPLVQFVAALRMLCLYICKFCPTLNRPNWMIIMWLNIEYIYIYIQIAAFIE